MRQANPQLLVQIVPIVLVSVSQHYPELYKETFLNNNFAQNTISKGSQSHLLNYTLDHQFN